MLKLDGLKAAHMLTARSRMQANGLFYSLSPKQMLAQQMLANGQMPNGQPVGGTRDEPMQTAGGMQPKQPEQGAPPVGPGL
jgi:hypothetical protein